MHGVPFHSNEELKIKDKYTAQPIGTRISIRSWFGNETCGCQVASRTSGWSFEARHTYSLQPYQKSQQNTARCCSQRLWQYWYFCKRKCALLRERCHPSFTITQGICGWPNYGHRYSRGVKHTILPPWMERRQRRWICRI